jgi:hypothetical protein
LLSGSEDLLVGEGGPGGLVLAGDQRGEHVVGQGAAVRQRRTAFIDSFLEETEQFQGGSGAGLELFLGATHQRDSRRAPAGDVVQSPVRS